MTFREAFEEMLVIANKHKDSAAISVQSWTHLRAMPDVPRRNTLTWTIWSTKQDRSFDGREAAEVVALYSDAWKSVIISELPEATAENLGAVGEVTS